jgi:hypothetical protein
VIKSGDFETDERREGPLGHIGIGWDWDGLRNILVSATFCAG